VSHQVRVGPAASREPKKLDRKSQKRIIETFAALADDPRPHGVEKISNYPKFWRIRVGDYRVIYHISSKIGSSLFSS